MPKRDPRGKGSVLHLAPFMLGLNEAVEVSLRFVELRGRPHILYPAATPPGWISWATTALVRWRIGNKAFVGNASPVDDGATLHGEILPEYTRQFGAERVSRWFGPQVGCLALSESLDEGSYYDEVEALFDQAALAYDRTVQNDRLNLHLRTVSSGILHNLFPPG